MTSPACDNAPVPTVSRAIRAGFDDNADLAIAVTRVSNQPSDCVVLYEIEFRAIPSGAEIPAHFPID
jgi:hypothetical protein